MKLALSLLAIVSIFVAGCQMSVTTRSTSSSATSRARLALDDRTHRTVASEVRRALQEFERAEARLDAEAVVTTLSPDFTMLVDGTRQGYAETVEQIRSSLPNLRVFEPRFDDVQVLALDRNNALSSMIFHDRVVAADGSSLQQWGPTTMLWRREEGKWRIVFVDADHYPEPVEGETESTES